MTSSDTPSGASPDPENRPPGYIPGPESNTVPGMPDWKTAGTSEPDAGPRRGGRIRQQDAGSSSARPETVGEARARQRAQRERYEEQERQAQAAAAAAQKKDRRRKQMIGAGVGVGVVGTIALLYVAMSGNDDRGVNTETAHCTRDGQVVADSYCSSGTISPVTGFILLNGLSYRYNYGGNVVGNRISGGSYDRPANTAFRTSSGVDVDPGKATSFGTNGQSNVGSKPAPPAAGSGSKNINRGGLGAGSKAGSSGGGGSKSGGS